MSSPIIRVFYADGVLWEGASITIYERNHLPDGCYIYQISRFRDCHGWFRKDLTPVLLEDVPKHFRLIQLILS